MTSTYRCCSAHLRALFFYSKQFITLFKLSFIPSINLIKIIIMIETTVQSLSIMRFLLYQYLFSIKNKSLYSRDFAKTPLCLKNDFWIIKIVIIYIQPIDSFQFIIMSDSWRYFIMNKFENFLNRHFLNLLNIKVLST